MGILTINWCILLLGCCNKSLHQPYKHPLYDRICSSVDIKIDVIAINTDNVTQIVYPFTKRFISVILFAYPFYCHHRFITCQWIESYNYGNWYDPEKSKWLRNRYSRYWICVELSQTIWSKKTSVFEWKSPSTTWRMSVSF